METLNINAFLVERINNAAGKSHGYSDQGIWKVHYYNNKRIGYYESHRFKCHYTIYGEEIGYEKHYQSQYLYNKSSKRFGEQIEWR